MNIGIIGFGRFGRLLTKYLTKTFDVYVFDIKNKRQAVQKAGAIPASLREVCSKEIVVPAVPISEFGHVLHHINGFLKENSLVIDVCSVKEYPVKLMNKILPRNVQILATHPMFGPDSATHSLNGAKIVLCKVRIADATYKNIKVALKKKGLVVVETTPRKHDQQIAKTLFLTHFIGRTLIELGTENLEIDTEGYKRLSKVLEVVKNDSWQLFDDMYHYNKYSKFVRMDFIRAVKKTNLRLK